MKFEIRKKFYDIKLKCQFGILWQFEMWIWIKKWIVHWLLGPRQYVAEAL